MARRWTSQNSRRLSALLLVALLIMVVNRILGPRLYPTYFITITVAMVTLGTVCLLIFGTIDSVRHRIRMRKLKNALR